MGSQGVMFKISSKRNVTVKSFSFYTDAARNGAIQVYTRVGSYQGYELTSGGWQLVHNKTVTQNGQSVLTVLGNFDIGVKIPSNSTQSFYIVTANYIMYNSGSAEGAVLSQDAALILYQGESVLPCSFFIF
jgi:hypothetical protein